MADSKLTELSVYASDLERDGHVTIGVMLDGAFVPIAQHKTGLLDHFAGSETTAHLSKLTKAAAKTDKDAPPKA